MEPRRECDGLQQWNQLINEEIATTTIETQDQRCDRSGENKASWWDNCGRVY